MKHNYIILIAFFIFSFSQAQTVTIPDANFKYYLLNSICADLDNDGYVDSDVDTNNDGEIQVSEAEAVFFLEIDQDCLATSIVGIESFVNLVEFKCLNSTVINLDLSYLTTINEMEISNNNNLLEINLGGINTIGRHFFCDNNNSLTNLNLLNLTSVGGSFYFVANNSTSNLDLRNLQTVNSRLSITDNYPTTPLNVDLSSLTNVNQLINVSSNNLGSINWDNLTTIHGLFFRYNTTVSDLNLSNVITNSTYITSSNGIEISTSSLININLENLQSSVERIIIRNQGSTMNVNLNSLTSVRTSMTLSYDSSIVSVPNLIEVDNMTIAGDIQEVNLQSLETGSLFVNTPNDDLNTINLSSLTHAGNILLNSNQLTTLDLNNLISVEDLSVKYNHLTSINLNNLETADRIELIENFLNEFELSNVNINSLLNLSANPLIDLNLNNISVSSLSLSNTEFDVLDLSSVSLEGLSIYNNPNLFYLDIKNGDILNDATFVNVPNLIYVCVDSFEKDHVNNLLDASAVIGCQVNDYCTFVPGGSYFTIEGSVSFDFENNGCDNNDPFIPNLIINITNGSVIGTIIPNITGEYSISAQEGIHTITPTFEISEYFTINPSILTVDFPTDGSPINQDFCVVPNGVHNDLEIIILPIEQARPGFNTYYKVVYKNKGNTILSGSVLFNFDINSDLMSLVSSTPIADNLENNILTWNYTNLQPFESREISVTLNMNTPTDTPPLNGGDDLGFIANIFPISGDETPNDNNFYIKQTVVNSLDPNDKTCLEGETITPEQVGKYVHYLIRFENIGTASAVNIVVKDEIDIAKFDVSTLIPLNSSHEFVTRIKEDNIVEFIFEDINLPFDDANNDGYIAFKIKTLDNLVLGDEFSNDAEIYFDYNAPIITNDELTTVAENLSVEESELQTIVKIYPNPVSNNLFIESKNKIKAITIYDANGRLLQSVTLIGNNTNSKMDLSNLSKGLYFINIKTEVGEQTTKIIRD